MKIFKRKYKQFLNIHINYYRRTPIRACQISYPKVLLKKRMNHWILKGTIVNTTRYFRLCLSDSVCLKRELIKSWDNAKRTDGWFLELPTEAKYVSELAVDKVKPWLTIHSTHANQKVRWFGNWDLGLELELGPGLNNKTLCFPF